MEIVHPNIMRIFDSGYAEGGSAYIPAEYVVGTKLRDLISDGPLAAEAYKSGIPNRDMKRDNVLVESTSRQPEAPKILNLGIAAVDDPIANISHDQTQM